MGMLVYIPVKMLIMCAETRMHVFTIGLIIRIQHMAFTCRDVKLLLLQDLSRPTLMLHIFLDIPLVCPIHANDLYICRQLPYTN